MGEPPTMMMESSASRLWIFSAMVMASLNSVMVGMSGGIQRRKGNVNGYGWRFRLPAVQQSASLSGASCIQ